MRYSNIVDVDTANAEGIAVSLFLQGCTHHCYNCFNPETWDFNGGRTFVKHIEDMFIDMCKKPYINCVSILGGEPFDQAEELDILIWRIRKEVNKTIYVWSGYTYEYLIKKYPLTLANINFLIDGEYVDQLHDYTLKLRGSSNQRIIDVQESIMTNSIVERIS